MAYTRHGHQIPGSPVEGPRPPMVARCGGPTLCRACVVDVGAWTNAQSDKEKTSVSPTLKFFRYMHLPSVLHDVSRPFHELANTIEFTLPDDPQKEVALQHLLEAKDAAVRAALILLPDVED